MSANYDYYNTEMSIGLFTPCAYALNYVSLQLPDTKLGKFGQHVIQAGSYFTDKGDTIFQMVGFVVSGVFNDLRTPVVDFLNGSPGWGVFHIVTLPLKGLVRLIQFVVFEVFMAIKLALSFIPIETIINVCRGKNASLAYFIDRERVLNVENTVGFQASGEKLIKMFPEFTPLETQSMSIKEQYEIAYPILSSSLGKSIVNFGLNPIIYKSQGYNLEGFAE